MLVIQPYPIFNKNAGDLLKTMTDGIAKEISYCKITHESTPADIKKFSSKIIKKIWDWPSIQVFDDKIIKDYGSVELSINAASNVIPGLKYSQDNTTVSILKITFGLRYEGNVNALNYTVNYAPRHVNITDITNGNFTNYFYCQGDIDDCSSLAQTRKTDLVNLLNSNQNEIDVFFEKKRAYFEVVVDQEIQKAYQDGVNKKRGLDLL